MYCPQCNCKTNIKETRKMTLWIRRVRACPSGHKLMTRQAFDSTEEKVVRVTTGGDGKMDKMSRKPVLLESVIRQWKENAPV